ncbi:hypothetical protein [Oceanicella actignis]|uniref:hypothetical protein n=1 Tax=Oceanicella actignis TaxID=1189325 RepID=UPI000F748FB8|nr:hypothetical protein [Oceanicella actignis]
MAEAACAPGPSGARIMAPPAPPARFGGSIDGRLIRRRPNPLQSLFDGGHAACARALWRRSRRLARPQPLAREVAAALRAGFFVAGGPDAKADALGALHGTADEARGGRAPRRRASVRRMAGAGAGRRHGRAA